MVIAGNSIEDVLNRIYLTGIAQNGTAPKLYFKAKESLQKLDTTVANIYASSVNNAPIGWKRENCLVLVVDNLMFSYTKSVSKDGENVIIIHEIAENGEVVTESIENAIRPIFEFSRRLSAIRRLPFA